MFVSQVCSCSAYLSAYLPAKDVPIEKYQQYPLISIVFPRQAQQFVEHLESEYQQYPLISVVIPALNEARNLRHVLPLIPWFVHEIILVDGYSTDDTVTLVEQLRPTIRPPIHIIMQTGKGKGDALRVGCAASTGDIIVTLDADGSAEPREIPFFVEALMRGNDFAKGSRCILGGGSHDFTLLRR